MIGAKTDFSAKISKKPRSTINAKRGTTIQLRRSFAYNQSSFRRSILMKLMGAYVFCHTLTHNSMAVLIEVSVERVEKKLSGVSFLFKDWQKINV